MFYRLLTPELRRAAAQMPAVTLLGPRQSGKTTLARAVFPDHDYVSLELPDERAELDARALDEALLSLFHQRTGTFERVVLRNVEHRSLVERKRHVDARLSEDLGRIGRSTDGDDHGPAGAHFDSKSRPSRRHHGRLVSGSASLNPWPPGLLDP